MAKRNLGQTGEEAPNVSQGHGTAALGPSGSSDSGSDVQGGPGFARDVGLGLETGSTSDPDTSPGDMTAGPDIGDSDLDSDTDSTGTGERAAAGRDVTTPDGQDISVDRIVSGDEIGVTHNDDTELKYEIEAEKDKHKKKNP